MNFGSITNKYYNMGVQFLRVNVHVSTILLQKVKLFQILLYLTEFTMKLLQTKTGQHFRVMEKYKGIDYLNIFQFVFRLCYIYLHIDMLFDNSSCLNNHTAL